MRLTEHSLKMIRKQPRFRGLEQFGKEIRLSAPFLHGDEAKALTKALETDQSLVNMAEDVVGEYLGQDYVAGVSSVTAAIHIALKLAAERLYGSSSGISTPNMTGRGGALYGRRVFCPDFASAEVVNPVVYEGGEPVFIDVGGIDWGMDPEVLEMAFEKYPDARIVIMSHVYGYPGQVLEVKKICEKHGALLIEDASCALGAKSGGQYVGCIGDYGVFGFSKSSIVTGYGGGMLVVRDYNSYRKSRYWADGAMAQRAWPQHNELGYDYCMNEFSAAMICSQMSHIDEHIARKKRIFKRYSDRINDEVMSMIGFSDEVEPNYCYSCVSVESNICFEEIRDDLDYVYTGGHGTAGPMEIYEVMKAFRVECRPVYKSLHLQPVFRMYEQLTLDGGIRRYEDFFQDNFSLRCDRAKELYMSGICLPSDLSMTEEEQDGIIDILYACFSKKDLARFVPQTARDVMTR